MIPNNMKKNGLAYDNIGDPAFQNLQLSDLPPLDFDDILAEMPTWSVNQMTTM